MQQATNGICYQHRFWLFQKFFVRMRHAAAIANGIHRIDDLSESTKNPLWLRTRWVDLEFRMLLADQIKQSSDVVILVRGDVGRLRR